MTDSELLTLGDLNLAESAREMARWQPEYEIHEREDLLLVAGSDPFPIGYGNCAMLLGTEPCADLESVLERASAFFDPRGRGFTLWIRAHLDTELATHAQEQGFARVVEMPGMVLERDAAASATPRGLPERVHLVEVEDRAVAEDWGRVAPPAYATLGLPVESSRVFFQKSERRLGPHLIQVVAYLEDRPASAAMALLSHGIGGLYWVGTLEEARGRGLGEACTRRAGELALERGARCLVLQASLQGEPIYRRIGYRELTRYAWCVRGRR